MDQANKPIKITNFLQGPFVIVVNVPGDSAFPMVVGAPTGFEEISEAVSYIETHFAGRNEPYLGCYFTVVPFATPDSFIKFCSWEE